jgi:polysaccharide biosynthesis protein PslG
MKLSFITDPNLKNKKLYILIFGISIIVPSLLFVPVTKSQANHYSNHAFRINHTYHPNLTSSTPTPAPIASLSVSTTPTVTKSLSMPQRVNPVCVSSHIIGSSKADVNKQATLMQQAGVKWVRFDFTWGNMEQTKGVYNWSNYDYIVNELNSKGMHVIALVTQWGSPTWERTDPTNYWSPAKDPTDFGIFVQALATHYKGKISLYEIGNEPNLAQFWPPVPDVQAYTQLLITGYNGVKAADPTNKVISAGLSLDDDGGMTYLQDMYNDGAKNHFDYLGFHPYSWPFSPDLGYGRGLSSLADIKTILTRNGDSSKQIIATEFGWPSETASGGVDEATQANYINLMYQNIEYGNYQYVPIACVYDFVDDGTDKTDPENNFGVVKNNYSLKPAYSTLQQVEQNYNANFTPINP